MPPNVLLYGVLWPLGKLAVAFLETLGGEAAIDSGKSGLVAAALQDLSVGLRQGTYLLHRALLGKSAGFVGRDFQSGAD